LTERERDIARLIVEGLSNHEIAEKLVLTHGTVKWYCGQIYSKLGVNTRAQAIKRIQALHLLEKSLDVFRQLEDPEQIRLNLHHLSMCYYDRPDEFDEGIALAEEAISIYEKSRTWDGIAYTSLGIITYQRLRGQYSEALETASRVQAYMEGDHLGLTSIHLQISLLYFLLGHQDDTQTHLAQALSLAIELKADMLLLPCLYLTVGLLIVKESLVGAARLLGFVDYRANTAIASLMKSSYPEFGVFAKQLHQQLGESAFQAAYDAGRKLSLAEAIAYAQRENA
jgi:DNA-binding CsgD family transcriptional regulator